MIMNVKIKQNKNTPAVRVASAALAVFVLFFSLCVPSFAYSTYDWSDYIVPYVPSGQPSWQAVFNLSLKVVTQDTFNSFSVKEIGYTERANSDPIYCFGISESGFDRLFIASSSVLTTITISEYDITNSTFSGNTRALYTTGTDPVLYDSSSQLYYYMVYGLSYDPSNSSVTLDCPSFSSVSAGLSDLREYIDNGYQDIPLTGEFTYSLPAGNVIFIDVTNLNVAVDLSQNTPISYWGLGATQYSGTVSSIPNSFDLPISGTSIISWTGSGKADSFGKYSSWVSHATVSGITSDHNHLYYVVANPLQNNSTAGSGYDVSSVANGDITIHVSNSNSVKVYQLETSFNAGVYDSNSAGDTFTGSNDGSGGLSFTNDTTGNPDSPSFGGMTTPESSVSTIHDFLQNIATQISGFFSGAIGAVSTLVSAGRDFMQSVSGLYMWLPAPVYTVLTSAIILVITIGVIKVFV